MIEPLSTSSSNDRRPAGRWAVTWCVALLMAVGSLTGYEWFWRQSGYRSAFPDNERIWAWYRGQLREPSFAVALLGASRMQRGIDLDALSRGLDTLPIQLAVAGSSALPVLEALATDPHFTGTVLYSIAPAFSFNKRLARKVRAKQQRWVNYARHVPAYFGFEQGLRNRLQDALVFRSPDLSVRRVLQALVTDRQLPLPSYRQMASDRSLQILTERQVVAETPALLAALYAKTAMPYSDAELQPLVHYVDILVSMLTEKGGRVVFLRLPSFDDVRAFESLHYPRDRYWDVMARQIGAPFIHFEDYPELRRYSSGDGSHIDERDQSGFTQALVGVLEQRLAEP